MDITLKQAKLAKTLFQIEDNRLLTKIELLIQEAIADYQQVNEPSIKYQKAKDEVNEIIELAKEPMPETITAEQLVKEQGFNMESFNQALDAVSDDLFEDEEPLEELLKSLK
ncbi:MAG: hypothetical protein AB8G11_25130 [Saprospiraceae bacterium]